MKLVRMVVFGAAAFLLAGGYFASQAAFLNSSAAEYSKSVDSQPVRLLALLLLLACVVFAALPQRREDE